MPIEGHLLGKEDDPDTIISVALCGDRVISGNRGGKISFWDWRSSECVSNRNVNNPVLSLITSPSGNIISTSGHQTHFWKTDGKGVIAKLVMGISPPTVDYWYLRNAVLSPDGSLLAATYGEGVVVWEREVPSVAHHYNPKTESMKTIFGIHFLPDNRLVVTLEDDCIYILPPFNPNYATMFVEDEQALSWLFVRLLSQKAEDKALEMVEAGHIINVRDEETLPPLATAAYHNCLKVVEKLLQKGADANELGPSKYSALHAAAENNAEPAVLCKLLEAGAEIDAEDSDGMTPLCVAAVNGGQANFEYLLSKGANLDKLRDTANELWIFSVAVNGADGILKILIDDLKVKFDGELDGKTALSCAAVRGHLSTVELLLKAGMDPRRTNASGATALHYAMFGSEKVMLRLLDEEGVDPNAVANSLEGLEKDFGNLTPFAIAICFALEGKVSMDTIHRFLEKGADPQLVDQEWKTLAVEKGNSEIIKILGADRS